MTTDTSDAAASRCISGDYAPVTDEVTAVDERPNEFPRIRSEPDPTERPVRSP